MIDSLYVYRTFSTDPFENLAREQVLLERGPVSGVVLYLWQNERTVVIGRNQNAFKECRVSLLVEEGGRLARRLSGGGAVFHDVGNLNFTFLLPQADFDVKRQTEVICRACQSFGVPAEVSGRNDIAVNGQKFSGSAYYKNGTRAYHHGTLLLDTDMERMGRYLSPSTAKLKAKGVDSVRARVVNLVTLVPTLTRDELCLKLVRSAQEVYGFPAKELVFTPDMESETIKLTAHYASDEWRFGSDTPATFCCEERFDWGTVTLELKVERGTIVNAAVYTDAMDVELAPLIESALEGRKFLLADMKAGLFSAPVGRDKLDDVFSMLAKREI